MIDQNHYKMAQMTYPRQNLHGQNKIFEKYAISRSSIISIASAKSLFKNHFDHNNFICSPIFKIVAGHIRTNQDQDFDMTIIFLSSPIQKFSAKKTLSEASF